MFMEEDIGEEVWAKIGQKKSRRSHNVQRFSAFKQYLKKRAPKTKSVDSPRTINFGLSSPRITSNYASRRMVSSEKTSTSKKRRKSHFDSQKQSRADEYKQQIEHNLKATLKNEKRKKAGLARKLASMTLEAVDAEIDAATSEPVPSANLVTAFEDQLWFEMRSKSRRVSS